MNRDALLIPIFWPNFRVHVAVECVCYALNVVSTIGSHLLLGQLETNNLSRDLDNSSYLSCCLNIKRHKNSLLVVEYLVGNGSAFGDIHPPQPHQYHHFLQFAPHPQIPTPNQLFHQPNYSPRPPLPDGLDHKLVLRRSPILSGSR